MTSPTDPTPAAPLPAPPTEGVLQRHPTDVVSLVAGLFFAGVGGVAVAQQLDWVGTSGRAWWGLTLAGVALAALLALVAGGIRHSRAGGAPAEPAAPPVGDDG